MRENPRSSISLIGMPGAGKSSVGVILAKKLALSFVDTDLLIQTRCAETLQTLVDREGHLGLRRIEEEVIRGLDPSRFARHVIATGGSAVYSEAAMRHLKSFSRIVFLEVGLAELERRVTDFATRGLARAPGQSFAELFAERQPLYRRHAELTVPAKARAWTGWRTGLSRPWPWCDPLA